MYGKNFVIYMSDYTNIAPYGSENYNNFVFTDSDSYAERCKKKTEWVTRGRVESAFCNDLIFITLTYDKKHLPTTYKKCQDLQVFHQRETRKCYPKHKFTYDFQTEQFKDLWSKKWVTRNSQPLKLNGNKYRKVEIMSEQDFKTAKFDFTHSKEYTKYADCGLLVKQHLSDFLYNLKTAVRHDFNNIPWRFIANGEYGQNTHRPHFHILIFNYAPYSFDYYPVVRLLWEYGKIISVQRVVKNTTAVKKLSAYICAHTVKNDLGNTYQNELAPPFKIVSSFGGGIGYQITDRNKMASLFEYDNLTDPFYDFCRSLHNSLSAWNKKDSVKYTISDNDITDVYTYEFPRYYKDKVLNYLNLDIRQKETSFCRGVVKLCTDFCKFCNFHGKFDLLPIFDRIGCLAAPSDILTFFIQINWKKFAKNFGDLDVFYNFVAKFLGTLKENDTLKRQIFKQRFSKRKQEKKYQDYLKTKGYVNLN